MILKRLFPCALAACIALSLFTITALSQSDSRLRYTANFATQTVEPDGSARLETDPIIISRAEPGLGLPSGALSSALRLETLLMNEIEERLGARYVWGASGPHVFDCSGFVWSAFRDVGADFYRGSARSYWARFAPAREDEKYKFGTLVFFNNLSHVGIVADENGFYHASRRKGVIYSRFDKYPSHIDGFRRVPLPTQWLAAAE